MCGVRKGSGLILPRVAVQASQHHLEEIFLPVGYSCLLLICLLSCGCAQGFRSVLDRRGESGRPGPVPALREGSSPC